MRIINWASDSRRHERTPGWPRLGEPVALNVVNEYVSLYTKDQLQLVPQERPWGFTEEAEVLNGRLAMTAITISVALTADPTLKAIVATYRAAQQALPS